MLLHCVQDLWNVLTYCDCVHLQVAIWTLQWPLPCACLEESAGESSPCTSFFRQLVPFSVLQSFLACTTVRDDSRCAKFKEIMLNIYKMGHLNNQSKWIRCLYSFRCPVGPSWMFQCDWREGHSRHLCYLPWKTSHHRQWLLWSGTLLTCGNSYRTLNFNLTNTDDATDDTAKVSNWRILSTRASLQHRSLARQRW